MARFTFRIPDELHTAARRLAAERGVSFSALVREVVERQIELYEKEEVIRGVAAKQG